MKAWITFEKKPRLRHIGHLDLMRAMQRALRKSDLPICFSKGFNPHLQLTFAAPLSVGMYGLREVMEVPLAGDVTAEEVMDKLSRALPPELPCVSVRMVDDKHPAPMALLRAADFDIELLENADAMRAAVPGFLAQSEIIALRKTKKGEAPCDIRPMIYNLLVTPEGHLRAVLALCETATCKPDLLLQALSDYAGLPEKPRTLIARTQLYGKQFAPLETL